VTWPTAAPRPGSGPSPGPAPAQQPTQAGSGPLFTDIPDGKGKCRDCGRVLTLTWTGNGALIVHGPRAGRCPGSGRPPVPWLQASGLPGWDDLTDLDKGAAILQARYPGWPHLQPPYFDHPVLLSLGTGAGHRYAVRTAIGRRMPDAEVTRLLNLASAAHRARRAQPGHDGRAGAGRDDPANPARTGTGSVPGPQAAARAPGPPVTAGRRRMPASRARGAAPRPPAAGR